VTDLEMMKLCAEAMGFNAVHTYRNLDNGLDDGLVCDGGPSPGGPFLYRPLRDDGQAMALVKKLRLEIIRSRHEDCWLAIPESEIFLHARSADLNHAIVECVAKMQASK
jgi:hypothetical protein